MNCPRIWGGYGEGYRNENPQHLYPPVLPVLICFTPVFHCHLTWRVSYPLPLLFASASSYVLIFFIGIYEYEYVVPPLLLLHQIFSPIYLIIIVAVVRDKARVVDGWAFSLFPHAILSTPPLLLLGCPPHQPVLGVLSEITPLTVPQNFPYYHNFVIFVVVNIVLELYASGIGGSGWYTTQLLSLFHWKLLKHAPHAKSLFHPPEYRSHSLCGCCQISHIAALLFWCEVYNPLVKWYADMVWMCKLFNKWVFHLKKRLFKHPDVHLSHAPNTCIYRVL